MKKVLKNNGKSLKLTTLGFTLIELLAVIIILAIVALIATPIILDVVEDARKSAGLSEANLIYSGITTYCATEEMKVQMDKNYEKLCDSEMTKEDVKEMVNLGNAEVIEIGYGSKLNRLKVKSNGYIYTLVKGKMTEGDIVVEDPYVLGDLLKVDVGGGQTQNIYVLEMNGDEITGILDRNLGDTVAWISNEDYNSAGGNSSSDSDEVYNQNLYRFGPITANKALEERTSGWSNVTSKRLPKAEEMLKLTEFYENLSDKSNWESEYFTRITEMLENDEIFNCSSASDCRTKIEQAGYGDILIPEWATINLRTTGDCSENAAFGYWTSTPIDYEVASGPNGAWGVYNGYGGLYLLVVDLSGIAGVRPVITIDISKVQSKLEGPEYIDGIECE